MAGGRKVILIATNIARHMGGEALKALHYARWLEASGRDVHILTHERCRAEMAALFGPDRYTLVEEGAATRLLWRSRIGWALINLPFHLEVARIVRRRWRAEDVVLHYVNPISPVEPRCPPRGYRVALGPLNGNIYYPTAFRHRVSALSRLRWAAHMPLQRLLGLALGEKRRADVVLNSGGARTRASLLAAGAAAGRIRDVIDAGVNERLAAAPRARHEAENFRFVAAGRLIPYKSFDLAIRALAAADPRATLDILGDGPERPRLEALAARLGVAARVNFAGFVDNDEMAERYRACRAFLFPSMMDANGIVMQEAMMIGLPVIALNWGGPAALADDAAAVLVEPLGEDHVVGAMAQAMNRLATDPAAAEAISVRARGIAEDRFRWPKVAESWAAAY